MGRTALFNRFERVVRIARYCDHHRISTRQGLERIAEARYRMSRRQFLGAAGSAVALGAMGASLGGLGCGEAMEPSFSTVRRAGHLAGADVAIVGAGIAGLSCADALLGHGIQATIYEARANRVGGRIYSLGGDFEPVTFPGKVVERGAELIDTGHSTMRGYANRFRLTLENLLQEPGEVYYFFDLGSGFHHFTEEEIVDQYRDLVPCMHQTLNDSDIRKYVEAEGATPAEIALDNTSLREYLEVDCAGFGGALIRKAIDAAYNIEYGCEIDDQSCLAFLLFIHADRKSEWREFGQFSNEKYHVMEGNQAIPQGLANDLEQLAGPIHFDHQLTAVEAAAGGRVKLSFKGGGSQQHDIVVLAIPNTILQLVDLDPALVPAWKQHVIDNIFYGTNGKMMVGFERPIWLDPYGGNGLGYANLPAIQCTWESNPNGPGKPVLTNYTGGDYTLALGSNAQNETKAFLDDFRQVFPGAKEAATKSGNQYRVHLENWTKDSFTRGAYTCNQLGYFTTVAGLESAPTHPIYYAGEHTNSFYEWQGFMEGAALSGLLAASDIVKAL